MQNAMQEETALTIPISQVSVTHNNEKDEE
jgi:hypothetical protein